MYFKVCQFYVVLHEINVQRYLWFWKGDRLDKKFSLDLKDINERAGIDYEVSVVGDEVCWYKDL